MTRVPVREIRRRFEQALADGLDDVADDFVNEATKIIEAEAVDTGTLKNSVQIRRPEPLKRVISWTSQNAVFVHNGSRPHWPPLAPILAWVRRNLRTVIGAKGGRWTEFKPGPNVRTVKAPDRDILAAANAVRAKIAKEGTAPVYFVPRAWSRTKPKIATLLRNAVDEAFR